MCKGTVFEDAREIWADGTYFLNNLRILLPSSNSHDRIVCSVCCNALNGKVKPIQMLRDRNGHREVRFICASLLVRSHNNIINIHVNVSFSDIFYELK